MKLIYTFNGYQDVIIKGLTLNMVKEDLMTKGDSCIITLLVGNEA